jgi:hypothetical protein
MRAERKPLTQFMGQLRSTWVEAVAQQETGIVTAVEGGATLFHFRLRHPG